MSIDSFFGEYRFLSNFYSAEFFYDGRKWLSVEHLYQASKADNMKDFMLVYSTNTASEAKKAGSEIKLRYRWDDIKDKVMMEGLLRKFVIGSLMLDDLVKTSPKELIEGNNWHDNYWGNCTCKKCKDIIGENKLGIMLMKIRDMHTPFLMI